jgi:radical SAM superfamily enzyme YgiQ (UPF0313 family)
LIQHKYDLPLDDPCCYPLGFMYVSAMLKKMGHRVKVLNYNLFDYDLRAELAGSDAAMFTGFEEFLGPIQRDAEICMDMGIRTILGGALATFVPESMRHFVTTVVIGEGEMELGKALEPMEDGLIHIIKGEPPDLRDLPLPDYEGFGIAEYHRRHRFRYMGVITARGCPNHCLFCAQTCVYQERPLDQVFFEIDLYRKRYGIGALVINDNTLNVSRERFLEICRRLKRRKINWTCALRVEPFDEEMARAAAESGCVYAVVGVESLKQENLDRMHKGVRAESILRTLDLLNDHGIEYHGNLLVGFEWQSYDDCAKEVASIPEGYTLFPALVRPFVGTGCGRVRGITKSQAGILDKAFREYIEGEGKYLYPDLPEAGC